VSLTTVVDSLYVALKSIDRVDIVNMMEGQGPPTGQQGGWEQEASRSRHHERDHLSPAITNGKRHSTLHLSHIMLFPPKELAFPLIQLISAAVSSLSPYIWAMNLTFPLPILLSPGPELMTPLQNYVILPV